jgi:hypothetical protein
VDMVATEAGEVETTTVETEALELNAARIN